MFTIKNSNPSTLNNDFRVTPSERLSFIKKTLGEHNSIKLVLTEALDEKMGIQSGKGVIVACAHSLTIECHGRGYKVQDLLVDSDGNAALSEMLVTAKGRYVWKPNSRTSATDRSSSITHKDLFPPSGQEIYKNSYRGALLDRLVLNEQSNDIRIVQTEVKLESKKRQFDADLIDAREKLKGDPKLIARQLRTGLVSHALSGAVRELLPLAKGRAAHAQSTSDVLAGDLSDFKFGGD